MVYVYQIYYDAKTLGMIDPEFIPIENLKRDNDHWYEYPAILNALNAKEYRPDDYIGVLSPRFSEKTGMSGKDVIRILEHADEVVLSFSPNMMQSSLFLNSFYQGERHHPGLMKVAQSVVDEMKFDIDLASLCQDQSRIIFSNYFVAKYKFWQWWLEIFMRFKEFTENKNAFLYNELNRNVVHRKKINDYNYAIFIAERLVSLLLEKKKIDAKFCIDLKKYYSANKYEVQYFKDHFILDSLKANYLKTGNLIYLKIYKEMKIAVSEKIKENRNIR